MPGWREACSASKTRRTERAAARSQMEVMAAERAGLWARGRLWERL